MHLKSQYKKFFYKNNYIYLYLIFISIVSILSIYFGYNLENKHPYLVDKNNNIILSKMLFSYGELVNNLYYNDKYAQTFNGIESFLVRLPFLPLVTTIVGKISLNIYFFLIVKNIIFFSVYFFSVFLFLKNKFNEKKNIIFVSLL